MFFKLFFSPHRVETKFKTIKYINKFNYNCGLLGIVPALVDGRNINIII